MKNPGYQLLVLDIDGTVTNSQKKVTEKTRNAVIWLQEQGVRVVLASGRPPEGVFSIAEELELKRFGSYILAFNGAKIIDYQTKKCIYEKCLPVHLPSRLWQDAKRHGIGIATYRDGCIVAGTKPDDYIRLESRISRLPVKYIDDFGAYVNFPVNECLLTGDPADLEALEPVFTWKYLHEAQVYHSEPWYLEVVAKNVDKSHGLKHLLQILGIPRESMVCCGDSYNDMGMLQLAGVGAAMANAPEKVRALANYVTPYDNDHDGVAEMIAHFWKESAFC